MHQTNFFSAYISDPSGFHPERGPSLSDSRSHEPNNRMRNYPQTELPWAALDRYSRLAPPSQLSGAGLSWVYYLSGASVASPESPLILTGVSEPVTPSHSGQSAADCLRQPNTSFPSHHRQAGKFGRVLATGTPWRPVVQARWTDSDPAGKVRGLQDGTHLAIMTEREEAEREWSLRKSGGGERTVS